MGVFPGCPVVKNIPSNAGDTGSNSGQGTKNPHATGQLSLQCHSQRAHGPQLESPCTEMKTQHSPKKEKLLKQTKGQLTECEKIFAYNVTDNRLISKIHKELIQLNIKKIEKFKNGHKT